MTTARCPTCSQVLTIHNRDGTCPRWAGVRGLNGDKGTRVQFRIGNKPWPDCDGHVLAYFADSVCDGEAFVWDLTAGTQFMAPRWTADTERRWTRRPTLEQVRDASEDLGLEIGDRVMVVKRWEG